MKGLIAIIFLTTFACSGKVIITEAEITPDNFYVDGSYGPFTGKCSVVAGKDNLVLEEFTYRDGRLNGEAQIWYGNGKMKRRGSFRDGKLSGKWEYWDQNGNMVCESTYHEDELVSTKYPSR
jgi:antitoxin component YwqK of YwqJK toxin-antitoxin module